jgi:hypothetical protein
MTWLSLSLGWRMASSVLISSSQIRRSPFAFGSGSHRAERERGD